MQIKATNAGMACGVLLGVVHLSWGVMVAAGWAQPVMDYLFQLHFIAPFIKLEPFNLATAVQLVVITTAIGFVLGYILAVAWNRVHSIGRETSSSRKMRPAS